ncbi:glycosyltransferase family 47 protein [bacterium]|nr:glycosyltransferase family 47 protein [bacterium]
MALKVFSFREHYDPKQRYFVNDLTKSLWSERVIEAQEPGYDGWLNYFEYEPDIKKADVCLLTYFWSHYVDQDIVDKADFEVRLGQRENKPVIIFNGGDYPANVPFNDVVVFESAGYHSTPGLRYHSAQPTFIPDYVGTYCQGKLRIREKSDIPTIGFCGQVSTSPFHALYRKLRLTQRQRRYREKKSKWEPPPFETTTFRTRVLSQFSNKSGLKTNYVLRSRYHGGDINDHALQEKNKIEFVENLIGSDYVVCMRGGGNYSLRFYETLCVGRIPIFIDTDCLLPFQDVIDYRKYFPIIDITNLQHAGETVKAFHANLSNKDFINAQKNCRSLWEDHMTENGFYRDFLSKVSSFNKAKI